MVIDNPSLALVPRRIVDLAVDARLLDARECKCNYRISDVMPRESLQKIDAGLMPTRRWTALTHPRPSRLQADRRVEWYLPGLFNPETMSKIKQPTARQAHYEMGKRMTGAQQPERKGIVHSRPGAFRSSLQSVPLPSTGSEQ